ncbi:carboxylating nicotinate-nucleotide diphosphorylase [Persephonella atlantica]|uniref:nicotinate-nucleotide diphosphorylase (carboxylating) n=1 Tax=Persephonella atlantica TaxID=2699429 RepID=A0ABS1GIF5_9AQUI|nr:carboxylating nicotinate-nucleotide diphosphorylase [Persephonella atlantica]MBK3332707.1 carboxylating nicotinate-nucleotide diphosphorylase [Persephonella atlantica]
MLEKLFVRKKIEEFLLEDIGHQDITTENLTVEKPVYAEIVSKDNGIIAGLEIAITVFDILDPSVEIKKLKKDGDTIFKGEKICEIYGDGRTVLKAERVMLNIIQKLSGIATTTSRYVEKIKGTGVKLLDTRKTTPGLRAFEKYAVRVGGGFNHRFALHDMVMIKDNHIVLAGGIKEAVRQIKEKVSPMVKVEVEVSSLEEFKEALETEVDVIMLDNMSIDEIKEAVKINRKRKLLEASGNITLENIREYALTGIDFISSGSIIYSAKWLDISLKFK